MYTLALARDDNGTVLVTCPDLSEVTTFGEDKEDALHRAVDAIEEALAARIARHEDIPAPSPAPRSTMKFGSSNIRLSDAAILSESDFRVVQLSALAVAKVGLYRAVRAAGVSKAEFGRRLGWHGRRWIGSST
jgi:antitoxin HicB